MSKLRSRVSKMHQWCPQCRMIVVATYTLVFAGNYMEEDHSVCDQCQRVLWDWKRSLPSKEALTLVAKPGKMETIQRRLF